MITEIIKRISPYFKFLMPWFCAALIFVYIFSKHPLEEVLQAASHANFYLFITFSGTYFFVLYFLDSFSLSQIFHRFGLQVSLTEMLKAKCRAGLFIIFNSSASRTVMSYHLKKELNVPFWKSASIMLFTMVVDLYWIFFFAVIGFLFVKLPSGAIIPKFFSQVLFFMICVCLLLSPYFVRLLARWNFTQKIFDKEIFYSFREASLASLFYSVMIRLPMHLAINTITYFIALSFKVSIPMLKVLAYSPFVTIANLLPISPNGIGATQLAFLHFFESSVVLSARVVQPAEILLSMSLMVWFSFFIFNMIVGIISLKSCMKFQKVKMYGA